MDRLSALVDGFLASTHSDAVDALRAFFLFGACTVLTLNLFAPLRSRFITYGARAASSSTTAETQKPSSNDTKTSLITRALNFLQSLQVPHSYFTQFYVVSILSSIFWLAQLLLRGSMFQAITARISPEHLQSSMSVNQAMLCWVLMVVHSSRRLAECRLFSKPSASRMWFVHWVLGISFYLAATVAIWIEGAGALRSHELTLDHVKITNAPSLRTFICLPLFLLASGLQHDCHHYLFSLKKYTLPTHPLFNMIVSPHYTAECGIYLSLAFLAAPSGEMVNKTLLSCLAFVAVNLGVTAGISKEWYMQKFGEDSVRGKWKMIPGTY
ncbi:putative 3-oxo-5-alpha-steroid 4-dehydrogenase [Aspergillus glaucus CBS 516.65]|uniref:Polyprenal reductase n=1 Tax=Aspergillus glaucus CBS 516.65 TaxID=1160497 RepID=A0A1L9VR55_ASPGL|nr:hypothetical protein ASPGLDRAFT_121792 [Aspergillus glaucus CBS 516.65]OJJ86382.1 hypothetical protein ASPGLDRAFT_121792 [Aspergillus glaucus CBS 516.65]